jgi:Icc protein
VPARIVQLTDLHLTAALGGRTRGQDVWANLRAVLDDVRARREPVDLLVLTGDVANERRAATYARLAELLEPWRGRTRVLPGNHDSRELLRAAFGGDWRQRHGKAGFVFPLEGWRIVGLDSVRRPFVFGRLGRDQLDWLAGELAGAAVPTLVFLHHPPVRVGCWWLDKDLLRDRRRLAAIAAGRVRAFACGHVHQELVGEFAGATVWTTPSTAYQFQRTWCPARIVEGAGYRVFELDGADVTTQVVRVPVPGR